MRIYWCVLLVLFLLFCLPAPGGRSQVSGQAAFHESGDSWNYTVLPGKYVKLVMGHIESGYQIDLTINSTLPVRVRLYAAESCCDSPNEVEMFDEVVSGCRTWHIITNTSENHFAAIYNDNDEDVTVEYVYMIGQGKDAPYDGWDATGEGSTTGSDKSFLAQLGLLLFIPVLVFVSTLLLVILLMRILPRRRGRGPGRAAPWQKGKRTPKP